MYYVEVEFLFLRLSEISFSKNHSEMFSETLPASHFQPRNFRHLTPGLFHIRTLDDLEEIQIGRCHCARSHDRCNCDVFGHAVVDTHRKGKADGDESVNSDSDKQEVGCIESSQASEAKKLASNIWKFKFESEFLNTFSRKNGCYPFNIHK